MWRKVGVQYMGAGRLGNMNMNVVVCVRGKWVDTVKDLVTDELYTRSKKTVWAILHANHYHISLITDSGKRLGLLELQCFSLIECSTGVEVCTRRQAGYGQFCVRGWRVKWMVSVQGEGMQDGRKG